MKLSGAFKLSLASLFLLCWVPFSNPIHIFPLGSFHTEWLAIFLGLCFLFCYCFIASDKLLIPRSCFYLLALASYFLVQPFLIGGEIYETTITAVIYLVWASLLICFVRNLTETKSTVDWIAWGIVLGALISSVYGIWQIYNDLPLIGTMNQANNTADYIFLGLISAFFLHSRYKMPPIALIILLILFASALAYTHARSVILYFVVFCTISVYFYRKNIKAVEVNLLYIFLASLLVCFLGFPTLIKVLREYNNLFTPNYSSDNVRIQMIHEAYKNFISAPLFGIGIDNYFFKLPGDPHAIHSHNIFTNLLAEAGLIGFSLFCAFLYKCFTAIKGLRDKPLYIWYTGCCLTIIGIHSMLEFPLWYANFIALAAIFIGISSYDVVEIKWTKSLRLGFCLVLIGAFCVCFNFVLTYYEFVTDIYKTAPQEILFNKNEQGNVEFIVPKDMDFKLRVTQ